jgi:hypothetical protein
MDIDSEIEVSERTLSQMLLLRSSQSSVIPFKRTPTPDLNIDIEMDAPAMPEPSPAVPQPSFPTVCSSPKPLLPLPDPTEPSLEHPALPAESSAPTDNLGGISDAAASVDDLKTPKETHAHLSKLIEKHLRELRKPKTILTDKAAANKILDLEALKRFNDLRLEYALKIQAAHQRVRDAPSRTKAQMRAKIPKIRPTIDASEKVAFAYAKGPSFARRLRRTAAFLAENGTLPDSNQGKGAFHASVLNNPDVITALRHWATGALDVKDGGFDGGVSVGNYFFTQFSPVPRLNRKSFADT